LEEEDVEPRDRSRRRVLQKPKVARGLSSRLGSIYRPIRSRPPPMNRDRRSSILEWRVEENLSLNLLHRINLDGCFHHSFSPIPVGDGSFHVIFPIFSIERSDQIAITAFNKGSSQFPGSCQFGLICVKFLVEIDEYPDPGPLRQKPIHPLNS